MIHGLSHSCLFPSFPQVAAGPTPPLPFCHPCKQKLPGNMRTVHGQLCQLQHQLQPLMRTSHLVESKPLQRVWADKVPNNHIYLHGIQPHWNSTPTKCFKWVCKPKSYWTHLNSFKKSLHIPQVIAGHAMSSCPTLFSSIAARGIRPQRQGGLIVTVTETLNVRLQPTEIHLWDPCYALRTARFCGTPWVTMWYTMYFLLTALCFDMFLFQGVGDAISCSAFSHWDASHWTGTPKWPKRVRQRETVQCAKISENIRKSCMMLMQGNIWNMEWFQYVSIQVASAATKFWQVPALRQEPMPACHGRGAGDDSGMTELRTSDRKSAQDFSSDCSNDSESFRSLRDKIRYRVSKPDFQTSNSWFPYSISSQHLAQSSWELPTLRVTASASTASEDAALGDRDTKWYEGFERPIGDTKNSSAKQIGDGRRQLKISNIDYSWLFCQSAVSESHDESSAIACAVAPSNSKWNISVVVLKKG